MSFIDLAKKTGDNISGADLGAADDSVPVSGESPPAVDQPTDDTASREAAEGLNKIDGNLGSDKGVKRFCKGLIDCALNISSKADLDRMLDQIEKRACTGDYSMPAVSFDSSGAGGVNPNELELYEALVVAENNIKYYVSPEEHNRYHARCRYIWGLYQEHMGGWPYDRNAYDAFQKAVKEDPTYFEARYKLAEATLSLANDELSNLIPHDPKEEDDFIANAVIEKTRKNLQKLYEECGDWVMRARIQRLIAITFSRSSRLEDIDYSYQREDALNLAKTSIEEGVRHGQISLVDAIILRKELGLEGR